MKAVKLCFILLAFYSVPVSGQDTLKSYISGGYGASELLGKFGKGVLIYDEGSTYPFSGGQTKGGLGYNITGVYYFSNFGIGAKIGDYTNYPHQILPINYKNKAFKFNEVEENWHSQVVMVGGQYGIRKNRWQIDFKSYFGRIKSKTPDFNWISGNEYIIYDGSPINVFAMNLGIQCNYDVAEFIGIGLDLGYVQTLSYKFEPLMTHIKQNGESKTINTGGYEKAVTMLNAMLSLRLNILKGNTEN